MSTESPVNSPEARIGYNTLQLANNQGTNYGVGTTGLGSKGVSSSYLDYFDYDSNDNLNYAASNLYNNNNFGLTGQGQSYGSPSYTDNLSYRQLLRRRQGLLAGGSAQLGQYGGRQLSQTGQLNQLSQAGQLNQLGQAGQMNLGNQLGLGQLGNLGKVDNLGLASSGYGATGLGGHSGYGGPVSVVSGYGPSQQCETGINPVLALLTLAGAAVGFYFLWNAIQMATTGRTLSQKWQVGNFESALDFMWMGMIKKIQIPCLFLCTVGF